MDDIIRKKCPNCGKVNKHAWNDKLSTHNGCFLVICECEESYIQAL